MDGDACTRMGLNNYSSVGEHGGTRKRDTNGHECDRRGVGRINNTVKNPVGNEGGSRRERGGEALNVWGNQGDWGHGETGMGIRKETVKTSSQNNP